MYEATVYKEITRLNTENPEAFLVEMKYPGKIECRIMLRCRPTLRDLRDRTPSRYLGPEYRDPTKDEMESIEKQMKSLRANSF